MITKTAAQFGTDAAGLAATLGSAVQANVGGILGLVTERILVSFLTKVLVSVPTLYEKYLKQENNR